MNETMCLATANQLHISNIDHRECILNDQMLRFSICESDLPVLIERIEKKTTKYGEKKQLSSQRTKTANSKTRSQLIVSFIEREKKMWIKKN